MQPELTACLQQIPDCCSSQAELPQGSCTRQCLYPETEKAGRRNPSARHLHSSDKDEALQRLYLLPGGLELLELGLRVSELLALLPDDLGRSLESFFSPLATSFFLASISLSILLSS